MKSPFIKELQPNQVITTTFLVHSKEIRQKKTGEPYLSLMLGDRTGEVDAKMWDNVAEVMETFDRDDFVKVKGLMQVYHNRTQLTIHKMRRMQDAEVDFADFFPASERDPNEMWAELRSIVSEVGNTHLKGLLTALLDDEEIAKRYRVAPAAKHIHHAYLGGLIEHVLSLCRLSQLTAGHYRNIDLDLMIAGAVLHDIGKVYELSYDRGFGYTTEGQLLGHMALALRMIADKLRTLPDFPPKLRDLVEHMILSHHGHLEFGSPKLPQFPEALLLHYLDDMDSKMECMRVLEERDRLVDGHFTSYNSALERVVLKKGKYLEPGQEDVAQEPVAEEAAPVPCAQRVENGAPDAPVDEKPAAGHPTFAPPAPAAPPRPVSPFADKLQQALGPGRG